MLAQLILFAIVLLWAEKNGSHAFNAPFWWGYLLKFFLQYIVPAVYALLLLYFTFLACTDVRLSLREHVGLMICTGLMYLLSGEAIATMGIGMLLWTLNKRAGASSLDADVQPA